MKPGDIVWCDSRDCRKKVRAFLVWKDEKPDLSELIDPVDISRLVEKTRLERWEVRFVGEPSNHTAMRWIDPLDLGSDNG